ncbi:MAG: hypothetical protein HXY37_04595, partial [Chloroflexi bacterium]|nr:hypothetical protein [Chloroflexota bacterium]
MKATPTASELPLPAEPHPDRWHMLGGERFYTLARWLTVVLLAAVSQVLTAA